MFVELMSFEIFMSRIEHSSIFQKVMCPFTKKNTLKKKNKKKIKKI
jgi:hypothetical protein